MRKQGLWKKYVPMMMTAPLLLGGCSLLPPEETGGHVVLVQAVDSVQYELTEVTREDVELVKDIYCTYQQSKEETLSFATSGRMVSYVHVGVGENVKKGDLLAELVSDDLVEAIKEMRYDIERETLLLAQAEERKAFDLDELKVQYNRGGMTRAQYEERVEQTEQNYAGTITGYQDSLYIKGMRMEKLEEELEGCKLYAGIDGMVSMIRGKIMEEVLSDGAEAIKIIDKTRCLFSMDDMEYAEHFTPGKEFALMDNNGTVYMTEVVAPEEAPDDEKIYLMLTDADAVVAVGVRAYARLVLAESKDVLALPKSLVHYAGDDAFVYCESEDGLKSVRYIKTGLTGSKLVEIKEGLEEGEMVIRK